jgi:hypothetical protein
MKGSSIAAAAAFATACVAALASPASAQGYHYAQGYYDPPRSVTVGPGYETRRQGNRSVTRSGSGTTYREGNRSVTHSADGSVTWRWNTPCGPASETRDRYGNRTVRGGC